MEHYFLKFGHNCELRDDELKNLLSDKSKLKRKLLKWTTINVKSNLTLQHFNSHAAIVNDRRLHFENHLSTIHPFSNFKWFWEVFIGLVFLSGLFYDPLMYLKYVGEDPSESVGNLIIMKLIKIFCTIDMFVRFFTGYLDPKNFTIVLDRRKIAMRYLRGSFIFDFLINIPLLVALIFRLDTHVAKYHFIKILTLLRITRLPTFILYSNRTLERIGVDDKYMEIFKLLCYWLVFIHWASCLHILPGLIATNFQNNNENAWYKQGFFQNRSELDKYIICLFKCIKTLMGTGYVKELQPTEYFDRIYGTLLNIAGRVGLCITFAYIFDIIQGMKSSTLRYNQMMVQLSKYTDQNCLPEETKNKLRSNYDYIFRKRYFNEQEILKTLPASLRQQILVHNTRQLVENSQFFENLPSSLVLKIISSLTQELFLEGDAIISPGEIGTAVYFIASGSVAFCLPNGKEVCHFTDGDYFGLATFFADDYQHFVKVVALETTECYKLYKKDFQNLIQAYPDLLKKVEELAVERIDIVLMIEEREKNEKEFAYKSINQENISSNSE
ncbi:CLUMA_CG013866, isoform A [Clunio marinus]|uniref:CLUMA_CG013866, isoform A n=1 Tax=Clunio marinus TaxID=568069 RepID=A0A1J1IND5_9DIPT|nr:CLUMA_CG013866, isoform A [Clunio marinus]